MEDVVIVAAGRSAVGSFGGALSQVPAAELGAQVLTAAVGQNPARQASLEAGLSTSCPGMTINKVCGSGLKATHLAAQTTKRGDASVILAGGQENMSLAPHVLFKSRTGQRMGDWKLEDTMIKDGLWDAFNAYHMGVTGENLADRPEISREQQDTFAARSQQLVEKAIKEGRFTDEIVPSEIPQRKGDPVRFEVDEFPRAGVTAEGLGGCARPSRRTAA